VLRRFHHRQPHLQVRLLTKVTRTELARGGGRLLGDMVGDGGDVVGDGEACCVDFTIANHISK